MSNKRFSDRAGITSPQQPIQLDGISDGLRNRLWNLIRGLYPITNFDIIYDAVKKRYLPYISELADSFFKASIDVIPMGGLEQIGWLRTNFFRLEWWDAYNFIEEFFAVFKKETFSNQSETFTNTLNRLLEDEHSGYRMVNGEIIPIGDVREIAEIEDALEASELYNLGGAREHFDTALEHFSNRPNPDYRNTIKESISAIESLMGILAPKQRNNFTKAIKSLEKPLSLHGSFVQSLIKLYGYTSDKDGIRHAIFDDKSDVGFDEAKFMLVSTTALFNFLVSKAVKYGLLSSEEE